MLNDLPVFSHDRGVRQMNDSEWLEVVGQPTIPHVQSLRCAPAQVALHSNSERLIGLTHRNAANRYLLKMQKERERNQEVLAETVDNLPVVIRYVCQIDLFIGLSLAIR